MVLHGALLQVGCAVIIGVPGAITGGRLLASQVYGVKTSDPLTLAGATVMLLACAVVAGLIAANRASRVDPMQALRSE
jgi:ABC-type antimicrobial peptide transport system permease subunit